MATTGQCRFAGGSVSSTGYMTSSKSSRHGQTWPASAAHPRGTRSLTRRHAQRNATCASSRAGRRESGKAATEEQPLVTGPLQMTTLEQLTSVERVPAPRWDTFLGISGGCWQGALSSFNPNTGEAEPVALGERGRLIMELQTILVDDRLDDGNVHRRVQHAHTAPELQMRGDMTPSQDEADWDTEVISSEEAGFVVFDGGSYSRGPLNLGQIPGRSAASSTGAQHIPVPSDMPSPSSNGNGNGSSGAAAAAGQAEAADGEEGEDEAIAADPDADAPEQHQAVLIEQCLAWGGESRVRLQIALACAGLQPGEELDVEVLNVSVFREAWECLTDNDACTLRDDEPSAQLPRLTATELAGDYKVFDVSAVSVEESDPLTGTVKQQMVYFSQETAQRWAPPDDAADDGAAIWLPGRLLLQLRMVPTVSRGQEADASEGMEAGSMPRGLLISTGWGASDGLLSVVEREYDGSGALSEVRARTAVRGGWVGGRM